jgi:type II secretory pathway pseudopilin PulG
MAMRETSRKDRGIGLIEVTIALLIFMVALLTLAQAITFAITLNRKNRENLLVTTLCKDKIEQLLALDFDDTKTNVSEPPQKKGAGIVLVYPSNGKGLSDGGSIAPAPASDEDPGKFYRDYIDAVGQRVIAESAFYTRQWRIETDGDMKIIRVTVLGPPSLGLVSQASMVAYKTRAQ